MPWLLLCVALAVLTFGNTLRNGFVYDDPFIIEKGVYVKDWSNFFEIYSADYVEEWGAYVDPGRPLTNLTYFVDYSLWGENPFGYHLTNLLLHLAATGALFLLVLALARSRGAALAAGAIFAIHPVLAEAVNAVSYREDLLVGLLLFVSLAVYVRTESDDEARRRRGIALSLAFYGAALLSKEMAVSLPLRETLLTMTRVVRRYIELLVWPHDLNADYVFDVSTTLADGRVLLSLLTMVAWIAAALAWRRRAPLLAFAFLGFLVSLLPVSNLLPLYHIIAERYLYFPAGLALIAFGWVVGDSLPRLTGRLVPPGRPARLAWLPTALVLVLCAVPLGRISIERNRVWQDEESLWSATLAVQPDSYRALNHLGVIHYDRGEYGKGLAFYQRALEIQPGHFKIANNIGNIYFRQGRTDQAVTYYQRALSLNPDYAVARANLGWVHLKAGRFDDAIHEYREAWRLRPYYLKAGYNLGVAYQRKGALDEALSAFRRVAAIDPNFRDTLQRIHALEAGPSTRDR